MGNQLAVSNFSYDEIERSALAMSKSGYFTDAREQSQAIVKILAGREMGFGPFASMTGVYIIQGRPSIGANLMASAVKRSGRYDYKVLDMSDTVCEIEYLQRGQSIGISRFTADDAKKAGTKNLDKFPRNMLFARAMSNGVRWYCPDVFDGAAVYTPEELGADVNEAGEVIDAQIITPSQKPQPQPERRPMNMDAVKPLAAPVSLSGKPAEITAARVEAIQAELAGEPAPAGPSDWDAATIAALARELGIVTNRVKNALNLSNLPFTATLADCQAWMAKYKSFRDADFTPQEAAEKANG